MKGLLSADGADIDGHVPRRAEDIDFEIGLRHIDQTPGADLIMRKSFPVHADRQIVIHSARQVSPVRRRKSLVRERFEIHDAQSIFGKRDGRCGILRQCGHRKRTGGEEP
jgi:hypothetical protein